MRTFAEQTAERPLGATPPAAPPAPAPCGLGGGLGGPLGATSLAGMDQPLVWIDCEMTGLELDTDVLLEVAVIITDGQLNEAIEGPDLVLSATEDQLQAMPEVVQNMHRRSGLWKRCLESELTAAEVERQVLNFIKKHIPERQTAPLAGNSIHTDRAFLAQEMPKLIDHLHYRLVDVSSIKELARRWMPELLAAAPIKAGSHRALADIEESIEELRYYREALFVNSQVPQ